jgi:hypothetical protein
MMGEKILRNNFESEISNQLSIKPIVGDVCINFSIACILLVNNHVIKKIGLFNKKYFIYWEDFELFRRLKLHLPPKMGDLKLIRLNERLRMYRYKVGQSFTPHLLP